MKRAGAQNFRHNFLAMDKDIINMIRYFGLAILMSCRILAMDSDEVPLLNEDSTSSSTFNELSSCSSSSSSLSDNSEGYEEKFEEVNIQDDKITIKSADGSTFNCPRVYFTQYQNDLSKRMKKKIKKTQMTLPYSDEVIEVILSLLRLAYTAGKGTDYSRVLQQIGVNYSEIAHFFVKYAPGLKGIINLKEDEKIDAIYFMNEHGKKRVCNSNRIFQDKWSSHIQKISLPSSSLAKQIISDIIVDGNIYYDDVPYETFLIVNEFIRKNVKPEFRDSIKSRIAIDMASIL